MQTIKFNTKYRSMMLDTTEKVKEVVIKKAIKDGLCTVFATHTTASMIFFENRDLKLRRDFLSTLNRITRMDIDYESSDKNVDVHIKASICDPRVIAPVVNRELFLGEWQAIYFCEFDGSREQGILNSSSIK